MKAILLVAVLVWPFAAPQASQASPVTIDVAGTVNDTFSFSADFWPLGTFVSGSLTFDVGPGGPLAASISGASGSLGWTTGSDAHVLTLTGPGFRGFTAGDGTMEFRLPASDPSAPEIQDLLFFVNIGENPFTSTGQLYNLLLGSTLGGVGLDATRSGTGFSDTDLLDSPRFSIEPSAVPEPASVLLLGTGGLVLIATLRRREKQGPTNT